MPDHTGRRRRQSKLPIGQLLVLAVTVAAIIRLLTLTDPARTPEPTTAPVVVAPTWSGPAPVTVPGVLPDGATYTPRIFVGADTSVGLAVSPDSLVLRVVLRGPGGQATELRRLTGANHAQFDGFVVSGDAVYWMESVSRAGSAVSSSLWRSDWRAATPPTMVTSVTGEVAFFGGQDDLVVADGRAYWMAIGPGDTTDVRSVPVDGGQVTVKRITGQFALSSWPWAVSIGGGRGLPVRLVNLSTDEQVTVGTSAAEIAACSPLWCRMAVLDGPAITRIDVQRPDGSARLRIAGSEATPTIVDVALLDRFVPLATDRGDGGVGLSVFDLSAGRLDLVTDQAANIQGRDGTVWWSTGSGASLLWHAVDLRALS